MIESPKVEAGQRLVRSVLTTERIKVETEVEVEQVVLTMDVDVAKTLYAITRQIGGDPRTTYRGDMDRIGEALNNVLRLNGIDLIAIDRVDGGSLYMREIEVNNG